MKEWIVSIVCLVIMSTILLIIIPEGKTKNVIKNIFQITVILIVLTPLTKVDLSSILHNSNLQEENQIETFNNQDFFVYINNSKLEILQFQCEEILEDCGINNAICDIGYIINDDNVINVKFIIINLTNAVIISKVEHIVVIEQALVTISTFYDVPKECVFICK